MGNMRDPGKARADFAATYPVAAIECFTCSFEVPKSSGNNVYPLPGSASGRRLRRRKAISIAARIATCGTAGVAAVAAEADNVAATRATSRTGNGSTGARTLGTGVARLPISRGTWTRWRRHRIGRSTDGRHAHLHNLRVARPDPHPTGN